MAGAQMKDDGKSENWTVSSEFYILAFSVQPESQVVLFIGILGIYLIAMIGNMIITMLILLVVQLHTPMYFFLCNLSLLDMTFISVTLPKLLSITLKNIGTISFNGCIAQMYFFISTANIESFLLTSMAYDRYVAICNPLRYPLILTKTSMLLLSSVSWFLGFSNSLVLTLLTSNLSFCRSHTIQNFFCDLKALLKLSCSDTTTIERIILVDNFLIGFIPYMLTMTSYLYIIATVLKIQSLQGKLKAFSNCTSHLTIVLIYYAIGICLYTSPDPENALLQDGILSLIYIALIPMINPVVYSLRNKEVLGALKKVMGWQRKSILSKNNLYH